jgi:predicted anti-sigma-YlaC factor YlaD
MDCDRAREAISARIDGEDPGVPGDAVEAHLETCAACRGWQQRAHAMTRRARLGGPFLDHDLTARVLAIAPEPAGVRCGARGRGRARGRGIGRGGMARRAGLAAVAVAQLAITIPLLILGHDHDAGVHAAHELGSFDLALAIAFAVGAVRPALSAGLAWPCGIAAAGLAGTAIVDLIAGQTFGADEAQHLVAVAGAVLLCWQARTAGRQAAPVLAAEQPGPVPGVLGADANPGVEMPPAYRGGGAGAARTTGPDVAARQEPDGDRREAVA